jgi:cellobiose-specific phosphotransferase system component IIA
MNALELADMLAGTSGDYLEAAAMLRKQDAAIKQLRDALTQVVDASERGMAAVSTFILIDAKEALATTENIHG